MFLDYLLLKKCLFIDIETVSEYPDYEDLPEDMKYLWDIKSAQIKKSLPPSSDDITSADLYVQKAGIFAEFSKVACISMGFLSFEDDFPSKIRIKSLAGHDEKVLLEDFSRLLINHYNDPEKGFGVSSPIWDVIIGSNFDKSNLNH